MSLARAGLYYLTNLTAPIAGYLIGTRSDRAGRRLGLFRLCAAAGSLGWIAMASAYQVWMPFAISVLILAFSGGAASQLFAAVHDGLRATGSTVGDGVVSTVRALGLLLSTAAGPRVMVAATAGTLAFWRLGC